MNQNAPESFWLLTSRDSLKGRSDKRGWGGGMDGLLILSLS